MKKKKLKRQNTFGSKRNIKLIDLCLRDLKPNKK